MQRPFYIIKHRANEPWSVEGAVTQGANAVECDIRHGSDGFVVQHPPPVFDRPFPLVPYLNSVATLASTNDRPAMVIFDCKMNNPALAVPLLNTIRSNLTDHVSLNIVISVASFEDRHFLEPLAGQLQDNECVAIDEYDRPVGVSRFFRASPFPADQRHAYGNGVDSLFPENPAAPNVPSSIMQAVAEKVLTRSGLGIRFVYVWTLDNQDSMRDYLRMGVDGIMTNDVTDLVQVVGESEFRSKVRIATRSDNPFAPFTLPAYVLTVWTGDETHAGTDANLKFTLYGEQGSTSTTINAKPPGLFEQGGRPPNYVSLIGVDVGAIQKLTVSRDTQGNAPGWFLWHVEVRSAGSRQRDHSFVFRQWISPEGDIRPPGVTRWVAKRDALLREFAENYKFSVTDPLTHDEVKVLAHEWMPEIRFHEHENFHCISLGEFLGLQANQVRRQDRLRVHHAAPEYPPVFFASHDWRASVEPEDPEVTTRSYVSNVAELASDAPTHEQRDRSLWGMAMQYFGSTNETNGVLLPRIPPITAIAEYRDLRQTLLYRVQTQIDAEAGRFPIDDGQVLDAIQGPPLFRAQRTAHLYWLRNLIDAADRKDRGEAGAAAEEARTLRELEADDVITQSEWRVIRDFAFLEYYFVYAYNDISKHHDNPLVVGDHEGDVESFVAVFDRNEVGAIKQFRNRMDYLQKRLKPRFLLSSAHGPGQGLDSLRELSGRPESENLTRDEAKASLKVWVMPGSHATYLKPGEYDLIEAYDETIMAGSATAAGLAFPLYSVPVAVLVLLLEHLLFPDEETSDNGVHAIPPSQSLPSSGPPAVQSSLQTTPLSRDQNIYQDSWGPGDPTDIDVVLAERSFPGAWGFDGPQWINKTDRYIKKLADDVFET